MPAETEAAFTPMHLLAMTEGLLVHQALYAVAKLGVADLLRNGPGTTHNLARKLNVNDSALYRVLRVVASQGVFEETEPRTFVNTTLSQFLCTGAPGSIRPLITFRGSEHYFPPFGEILYSIRTGESARTQMDGRNGFESLRRNPDLAELFDDAMTNLSELDAPAIASSYDFGQWGTLMDVGGGNGFLLATILKLHRDMRGVLADQPHVLERARQRGFLGGELKERSAMQECDFFHSIPSGCGAYLMKNVLVDWNDEQAHAILVNCRRAVREPGALVIVEFGVSEDNLPSRGKFVDLAMLVLTGGKIRSAREYGDLLASARFRVNQVTSVRGDLSIIEARPT